MKYEEPACAYCPPTVRACRVGESEARGPGYCPSKTDQEAIDAARVKYDDPTDLKIAQVSARVEAEGYCKWPRVQEICEFAKKMGYRKLGIATCISFVDLARVLSAVFESHGFDVASAACKNGGVPKEELGLLDEEKIRPGNYEAICNPISQAELLNRAGCDFNVVLGLCVGHDSLFFKHSEALGEGPGAGPQPGRRAPSGGHLLQFDLGPRQAEEIAQHPEGRPPPGKTGPSVLGLGRRAGRCPRLDETLPAAQHLRRLRHHVVHDLTRALYFVDHGGALPGGKHPGFHLALDAPADGGRVAHLLPLERVGLNLRLAPLP